MVSDEYVQCDAKMYGKKTKFLFLSRRQQSRQKGLRVYEADTSLNKKGVALDE